MHCHFIKGEREKEREERQRRKERERGREKDRERERERETERENDGPKEREREREERKTEKERNQPTDQPMRQLLPVQGFLWIGIPNPKPLLTSVCVRERRGVGERGRGEATGLGVSPPRNKSSGE